MRKLTLFFQNLFICTQRRASPGIGTRYISFFTFTKKKQAFIQFDIQ